jgi:predicted ATPase
MEKKHVLDRIRVRNFKSIRQVDLELNSLNVLIGANGSGKSNFIGLFKFLRKVIQRDLQRTVEEGRGAEHFLYYGSKVSESMGINLEFSPNAYEIRLKPAQNDRLIFQDEICKFHGDYVVSRGINTSIVESDLSELAKENFIANYVYKVLSRWRVYHFHDTSSTARVKKTAELHDVEYLREDAANLSAFLYSLRSLKPLHYERIVKMIRRVVPDFRDFYLEPSALNTGTILLRWNDTQSEMGFTADDFSDGSLRFICLTTLLMQPELPPLILIDEPELGLHPHAIDLISEMLKLASGRTQVIVATQSERLISTLQPEDVIVVDKEDGSSTFKRLDKDRLSNWLEKYNLSEMWDQNIIGGQP